MITDFILIIIAIRYLRTFLKASDSLAEWEDKLTIATYASAFMIAVVAIFSSLHFITVWIGQAALLYLVYVLYKKPEFKSARQVLIAIAPYILISLFSNVVKVAIPPLYKSWSGFLQSISFFSIVWMIGVWFLTIRQKRELDKANKRVEEEEKNNQVIRSMKDELEVQVAERTAELTKQKEELEHALHELKSTQAQLIQSEKMASLGELTAGIAHEIQNPLNFVNNFSEVNNELIEEMNSETDVDEIKAIANDIKQNNEKIAFHGKRADAIVKGMLQHSRKSTGQKELTDINALCDEYLRLSFHGLRAKDKSFNANFKTEFDESIGKINAVPQDLGRVLLNLINNAFYAVSEKKKTAGEDYKPEVVVATKKINNKIEIKVRDNGSGIPQNIIDKIFQPFFTTKPTGQGTGLGLSLAYDIITKEHNGTISVESKDGEGTTFIINLPFS
ncbi:MAG TPA: ATP-binding protein [Parafilimonas sp.]|nr:ATP-binding protein [Parafilimonas sp.]